MRVITDKTNTKPSASGQRLRYYATNAPILRPDRFRAGVETA
jgi:hypothetical protein